MRRFVHNKRVAPQIERYAQKEKRLSYAEMRRLLTAWRNSAEALSTNARAIGISQFSCQTRVSRSIT